MRNKPSRRSFFASSIALGLGTPASLLASVSLQQPKSLAAEDRRFMSFEEHLARMGEDEALFDLRNDLFPITMERSFWSPIHTPQEKLTDDLASYYGAPDVSRINWGNKLSENPWRVSNCLMFLNIQSQSKPIKDWWLLGSRCSDMTARLWIVYVSTAKSLRHLRSAFRLSTEVRDRMHRHRKSMVYCNDPWFQTIQLVNREILASIEAGVSCLH